MIYSTQTDRFVSSFGYIEGVKKLFEIGYPSLDFTMHGKQNSELFSGDWRTLARELRRIADGLSGRFNQAHAPFGGGYDFYSTKTKEILPRAIEFASILGADTIVIHPLQRGRYYSNEKELFDLNLDFYSSLAPYARDFGIKIGIENMWQHHPVTKYIIDDVCAPPEEHSKIYDVLSDPKAFTVCLDIGHVGLCGREPDRAIREIGGKRLGALHVHDNDYIEDRHTLPYFGKIKWDSVCLALAEIDYQGVFTLEAEGFLQGFSDDLITDAAAVMKKTAAYLVNKIEQLKGEIK